MNDRVSIKRINDHTFLYKTDDYYDVKIHFKNKNLDIETCSNLAKKIAKIYAENSNAIKDKKKTHRFRFGKRNWKVYSAARVSWFIRVIRIILPFFHLPASDNTIVLHVDKGWLRGKKSKKSKIEKRSSNLEHRKWKSITKKEFSRANFKRRIDASITAEEYKKGIRAQVKLDGAPWEKYQDPFTKLASLAFQNYEKDFVSHDDSTLETSDYKIIYQDSQLKLIHKDEIVDEECHQMAVKIYLNYVQKTFGEKKISSICQRYGIELPLKELTPEHVYRINIGTAKLYKEDENPIFSVEAIASAFTGREIHGKIASAYTMADGDIHKPWIDDQELLQTFKQLIAATTWDSYMEIVAHIVSKKHLSEKLSNNEYRGGVLIPAPSFAKEGEKPQYFKVERCITNGFIHGYIFEGHGEKSKLPVLLVDRSTATSRYAFYNERTIMNDFNHFYSPGHMGIHLLDEKIMMYLKDKTIPIWVGYQNLAKAHLQNAENASGENAEKTRTNQMAAALEALKKAVDVLDKDEKRKYRTLNLREILQKHDMLFESLYLVSEGIYLKKYWNKKVAKFSRVLGTLISKYINIHFEDYKVDSQAERKAAEKLISLLKKIPQVKAISSEWYKAAISDLKNHIINNNPIGRSEYFKSLDIIDPLLKDLQSLSKGYNFDALNHLCNKLEELAVSRDEAVELKKEKGIDIWGTGHSLGAACMQEKLAQFFVSHNRMPLPKHKLQLALFDSPKVNREDNINFKNWGKQHRELFKAHQVTFSLKYSFEEGDPVPLGGEEFIGATFSEKEAEDLGKWLNFEAHVYGRKETSSALNIAGSEFVHDTLFQEGIEEKDYTRRKVTTTMLGLLYRRGNYMIDLSPEMAKKKYHEVYSQVFKFPTALEGILDEEFRKSVGIVGRKIRAAVLKNPSHHILPDNQSILDVLA